MSLALLYQLNLEGAAAAPTLVSLSISANGFFLDLTGSRALQIGSGGQSGLVITASGGAVGYETPSGSNPLRFPLDREIQYDETITATYVNPGDGVEALDDQQDLANFTDELVSNGSMVGAPVSTMNQSARQTAFRLVSGTSGTYDEDFIAYAKSLGHTGTFNELMIKFIQGKLTSSKSNLPDLQAEAASDRSKSRWTDLGSDVTNIGS